MQLRPTLLPAFLLLFARAAPALYRGDEDGPRDFKLSSEYFQDVAAIRPPRDEMRAFENADSGYIGAAGSVTAADLYLEHHLKLAVREDNTDGTPAFRGAIEYEEGQDFNASYRHFTLRGGPALDPDWSFQVVALLDGRKELADFGLSLRRDDGPDRFEARLTFPNFVYEGKNPEKGVYEQQPLNFLLGWRERLAGGVTPWVRSESDFRSRTRFPEADDHLFVYQSYRNEAGVDIPAGRWTLFTRVGRVHTRKEVAWASPEGYDARLDHTLAAVEAVSGPRAPGRLRLGLEYDRLQVSRAPQTPEGDSEHIDRDDYILYGYRTFALPRAFYLDAGLSLKFGPYASSPLGQPEYARTDSGLKAKGIVECGFEGKRLHMGLSPTWDIDAMKFGGGYAHIRWDM